VNRVSKGDWPVKSPIDDGQKRESINAWRVTCKASCDGETKQPVRDRSAEGVAGLRRMIYVERVEIARESRKPYDVRFGHCPTRAFPLVTNDEIIK
jgi:hypothetical protein